MGREDAVQGGNCGFGIGLSDFEGQKTLRRSGRINGFSASMAYFPSDGGLAVIALSNLETARAGRSRHRRAGHPRPLSRRRRRGRARSGCRRRPTPSSTSSRPVSARSSRKAMARAILRPLSGRAARGQADRDELAASRGRVRRPAGLANASATARQASSRVQQRHGRVHCPPRPPAPSQA